MPKSGPAGPPDNQDLFRSERAFQVWRYDVGHRLLLLRSVKAAELTSRIDVLFLDTASINLPTSFVGLRVQASQDGRYQLSGAGWSGEVQASAVHHGEDDGEFYDEGFFKDAFLEDDG